METDERVMRESREGIVVIVTDRVDGCREEGREGVRTVPRFELDNHRDIPLRSRYDCFNQYQRRQTLHRSLLSNLLPFELDETDQDRRLILGERIRPSPGVLLPPQPAQASPEPPRVRADARIALLHLDFDLNSLSHQVKRLRTLAGL
jgi:hypothetical protein